MYKRLSHHVAMKLVLFSQIHSPHFDMWKHQHFENKDVQSILAYKEYTKILKQ